MRIAFFIVLLFIAFMSAMDIVCGDYTKKNDKSVAVTLGIEPERKRRDSVAVFLIAVVAMTALLIVEVLA